MCKELSNNGHDDNTIRPQLHLPARDPAAPDLFLRRFFPMKDDLLLLAPSSSSPDDEDSDSESVSDSLESEDKDSNEENMSF